MLEVDIIEIVKEYIRAKAVLATFCFFAYFMITLYSITKGHIDKKWESISGCLWFGMILWVMIIFLAGSS